MAEATLSRPRTLVNTPRAAKPRRFLMGVAEHSLPIVLCLGFVLPLLVCFATAFMTQQQSGTGSLWPSPWKFSNFREVFSAMPFGRDLWNTCLYAGLSSFGVVISSVPVAYAVARMRFRGRDAFFIIILATMMIPAQVTSLPLYVLFAKIGWIGSLKPLIVPSFFGDAFSIFLLRQFFLTLPQETIEAARVDGAGEFRILRQVVIPMARPAIAAVGLFAFMYAWNDFYNPLLYTGQQHDQSDARGRSDPARKERSPECLPAADGSITDVPAAGPPAVPVRAEGVHRRHSHDGEQGMIEQAAGRRVRRPVRVSVVGGGSTYTPELIEGFARRAGVLAVDELVLHDVSAERLDVVGGLARRILAGKGFPAGWSPPTSLDAAVDGAAAVLVQLRVGGQQARLVDETLPGKFGLLGQETTGPGGLRQGAADRAGRARHRRRRSRSWPEPDAWIVDFTNPVGIVTRALLDEGHRAIGLCNVAIGFQRRLAARFGVEPDRVRLDHAGLNHLSWIRQVVVDGVDRLPELLDRRRRWTSWPPRSSMPAELMRTLRAIPSYYLHYFYCTDEAVHEPRRAGRTVPSEVLEIERDAARDVRRPGARPQAGAARAARRRLLQRGGRGAGHLAADRRRRAPLRGRAQQRHDRRPAGRGGGRGAGASSTAPAPHPVPVRAAGRRRCSASSRR